MVISQQGIVATSQVAASQAGAQILARGGSAVDAAIAACVSMKSPAFGMLKLITGTDRTARQTLHRPLPHEIPIPV